MQLLQERRRIKANHCILITKTHLFMNILFFRARHWAFAWALAGSVFAQSQDKKIWYALDQQYPEGSPIVMNVAEANEKGTEIEVRIPGFWLQPTEYGGRRFYGLLLPAVKVTGKGYPQKRGELGWWDFPPELNQVSRPSTPYENAADGSVRKHLFPENALGSKPQTAEEMEKLGIDPAGARPGLPRLRMAFAASRQNGPDDLELQIDTSPRSLRRVALDLPIAPAGFEGTDAGEDGYTAPQLIDEDFYKNFQGNYVGTEETLGTVSGLGAFSGVETSLPVFAMRDPQTLEVYPTFTLYLKHLKGTEDFECPVSWDNWIFNFPAINGAAIRESLSAKGLKIETSRSAHYLIICPPDWRDSLQGFALWKQAKGLNVDFAYLGSDVAANRNAIDSYIEAFYKKNYCHGLYVLLCGDVGILPSGRTSRISAAPDYANSDSDHVYEVLGNERFPSAYVGRLSANSEEELRVQLAKILRYERNPRVGDWPTRATLCGNSQMDNGDYGVNSEWPTKYSLAVEQTVNYAGYTNPPIFQTLHAGAASNAVTRAVNADVIAALNAGRGQILYRGHGSDHGWVSGWDGSGTGSGTSFTDSAHVDSLTNRIQPIVYSIACVNARINQEDCMAERWMKLADAGAVAHYGASANSYTGENHERTKGIFRAIYETGHNRLGPMIARAEQISRSTYGAGEAWDSNTFAYNLLGDPEMTIRRKAVPRFSVAVGLTALLNTGNGGLTISVLDPEKGKVPETFVQITDEKGDRRNGVADKNGEVKFEGIDPNKIVRLDLLADGFPFTAQYLKDPVIEPVGFVEDGFKVRLLNVPQGTFRIYGSTDFKKWEDLGVATPVGNNQEFIDPNASAKTGNNRFYRAVQE